MKHIFAILFTLLTTSLISQNISGTDFWFTLPENSGGTAVDVEYLIKIISNDCGSFTLESEGLKINEFGEYSSDLAAELYFAPTSNAQPVYHVNDRTIERKAIHITTTTTATVYLICVSPFSMDTELILPTQLLGRNYVVGFDSGMRPGSVNHPKTTIVAKEDSTIIQIRTWNNGLDSTEAHIGTPEYLNLKLNSGETYMFSKLEPNARKEWETNFDIYAQTGSHIFASKPIAIISSTTCADVSSCGPCDMLMSMPLPTSSWGKKYTTVQALKRSGMHQVCGGENGLADFIQVVGEIGTYVNFKGTAKDTTIEILAPNYATQNHFGYGSIIYNSPKYNDGSSSGGPEVYGEANVMIEADKNIQVLQYVKAGGYDDSQMIYRHLDPDLITLYPQENWSNSYIVTGNVGIGFGQRLINELVVIAKKDSTGLPTNIFLDSTNINLTPFNAQWQSFGKEEDAYAFTRLKLQQDYQTYTISNKSLTPIGIYSSLMGSSESSVINGALATSFENLCLTASVSENNNNNSFQIFPNPANNMLTVQYEFGKEVKFTISSLDGKILNIGSFNSTVTIDISEFKTGSYLLELNSNNNVQVKRFLKN